MVTVPVAMSITRIVSFSESVTKMLPKPSLATPIGRLKRALVPVPSVLP